MYKEKKPEGRKGGRSTRITTKKPEKRWTRTTEKKPSKIRANEEKKDHSVLCRKQRGKKSPLTQQNQGQGRRHLPVQKKEKTPLPKEKTKETRGILGLTKWPKLLSQVFGLDQSRGGGKQQRSRAKKEQVPIASQSEPP